MRDRPDPDALSPRARARLQGRGWVPAGPPSWPPSWSVSESPDAPESEPGGASAVAGERVAGVVPRVPVGRHRRRAALDRLVRFVRLPAAFSGARWQPGRAAVLGVLLVTVLAVLVLGLRVAWARSDTGDVVAPGGGARAGPTGVTAGAAAVGVPSVAASEVSAQTGASAAGAPTGGAVLVVHVVGRVRHPGVQELAVGSRVGDAVAAAGGASDDADLSAVNLARLLVDGEQIRVPRPGEVVTGAAPGVGSSSGAGGGAAPGGLVSLNAADVTALDALPGIGPVLAQRIVDWRSENGRFTSVDELAEVSGIGEKLLGRLRPLVTP